MRAGRCASRGRAVSVYREVFGTALLELFHVESGLTLSGSNVVSWRGSLRSILLSAPSTARRPVFAADGACWGGKPVVQCNASNVGGLYNGAISPKISLPNNFNVCVLAVCRVRTNPLTGDFDPNRGIAGIVGDNYWSGYWPCNSSIALVFGCNPPETGYMMNYRLVTADRATTTQWWPPPKDGGVVTPQYGIGAISHAPVVGSFVGCGANGGETWGIRGFSEDPGFPSYSMGQVTRMWIGNILYGTQFTEAEAPVAPTTSQSLDLSIRSVAYLSRQPTNREMYRLRAQLGANEGCTIPTTNPSNDSPVGTY